MAKVRFFRKVNMDRIEVGAEDITVANSTLIRNNDGVSRTDYKGSFQLSGSLDNLNVRGTLREIDDFIRGTKVISVDGLNKDAATAAQLIGNNKSTAFLKFILSGGDSFIMSGAADKARGFNGSDNLSGEGGNDTIFGGNGNDTLLGGAGKDQLFGDNNNDRLIGGGADDILTGGDGLDSLFGGGGNDRVVGGAKSDILKGGKGADSLFGGGAADTIDGGTGNDLLKGGGGSDRFVFKSGSGSDRIGDFKQGDDVIKIGRGASEFADLTIEQAGANVTISFADVTITVLNAQQGDFDAGDFIF